MRAGNMEVRLRKKLVIEKERVLTVAFVFPRKDKVQKIV